MTPFNVRRPWRIPPDERSRRTGAGDTIRSGVKTMIRPADVHRRPSGGRPAHLSTLALPGILLTVVASSVGGSTPTRLPRSPAPVPAQDTAAVVHLLQRATFGARPVDIQRVLTLGVEEWLLEQTSPGRESPRLTSLIERAFPSTALGVDELLERYPERRAPAARPDSMPPDETRRMRRERMGSSPRRILVGMSGAKLMRAAHGERQLEEMMVDFWFDHFNIFFQKGPNRWLVQDYEENAIRPHVFGTFEEMLVATASHPAMLLYLDNARSGSVDTAEVRSNMREMAGLASGGARGRASIHPGRRTVRPRESARPPRLPFDPEGPLPDRLVRGLPGLNENYARELLELHTLGVDGGYTQGDVVAVAKAFTGWTFVPPRRAESASMAQGRQDLLRTLALGPGVVPPPPPPADPYAFWFRPEIHDRRSKIVLGHELPAGRGMEDGLEVLRLLARHPSTASHVATQLATRFVADDPPKALVERLAEVFLDTGGDLGAVTRALFSAPEFYDDAYRHSRTKPPFVLVASALRMTGARVADAGALIELLVQLGQGPYLSSVPTGYPEESAAWESAGATVLRANFAMAVASGEVRGVRVTPDVVRRAALAESAGPTGTRVERVERFASGLVDTLAPGTSGTERERTIDAVLDVLTAATQVGVDGEGTAGDVTRATFAEALGVALASPAFQKH